MFNHPIVKTVGLILVTIVLLKLFGSKIPGVGKYISIS